MTFVIPKDGSAYTASVLERCQRLIRYNVWQGVEFHRFNAWVKNFKTPEAKYFAAKLLDSLMFRSKRQTISMIRYLFRRTLPDVLRMNGLAKGPINLLESLKLKSNPGIRIVPVKPPESGVTKSGPLIARYARRDLPILREWFLEPDDISSQPIDSTIILFVDDFLGTGEQFIGFARTLEGKGLLPQGRCCYIPLAGHADGIQEIKKEFPTIHVGAVETLNVQHSIFAGPALEGYFDDSNTVESAREFYYDLVKEFGIGKSSRRGHGKFEIAYAFEHAIPDNSVPLLWWPAQGDWKPLFNR